jgi:bifunctional pyridoxal-dependent enzyme with beta-cystathionase and maltose regulon repressor activities
LFSLKLTIDTLSPFFQLLKGNPNPFLLQELMEDTQQALVKVERTISTAQFQHWDPQQPVQLLILHSPSMPTGALWQLQEC